MLIILTGGGSAGHVTPALSLVDGLKDSGYKIHYIGSNGIEKEIVSNLSDITYHEITCEKLRRSFSLKNFTIPFKLLKGIRQSLKIIDEIKPDIIFSKGGYVALPVVIAGRMRHIKILAHESDMSMGLANKIIFRFCDKMAFTFERTYKKYPNKSILTGSPIRNQIFKGNSDNVIKKYNLDTTKKTVLVFGGSLGSRIINETLRQSLSSLPNYNILHITGKGNMDRSIKYKNYHQIEFTDRIEDYFAVADVVISRAGSNSICELLALKKPMILIPLPTKSSRGDQILNAKYFKEMGYARVIFEENLTPETLVNEIKNMHNYAQSLKNAMSKSNANNANKILIDEINSLVNKSKNS